MRATQEASRHKVDTLEKKACPSHCSYPVRQEFLGVVVTKGGVTGQLGVVLHGLRTQARTHTYMCPTLQGCTSRRGQPMANTHGQRPKNVCWGGGVQPRARTQACRSPGTSTAARQRWSRPPRTPGRQPGQHSPGCSAGCTQPGKRGTANPCESHDACERVRVGTVQATRR